MPAAMRIDITEEQQAVLEERFEQARDAETRLRYQMVLLASDGYPVPQIAPLVRWSDDTVLRVLRRYRDAGGTACRLGPGPVGPCRCRPHGKRSCGG